MPANGRSLTQADPLGAMISSARHTLGKMSQEELAEHMGVGQSTISAWEAGRARPNYAAIVNLSRVLKLDLLEMVHAAANNGRR